MTTIPGTTRAQTLFLRAFRKSPAGPPQDAWPSLPILRRWLRRPAFRAALNSLREALRFQADFHLALCAAHAAQKFSTQESTLGTHDLNQLLRLAHLRQRFAEDDQPNLQSPAKFALRNEMRELESSLQTLREQREQNHDDDDDSDNDNDSDKELFKEVYDFAQEDMLRRLKHLKSLASPISDLKRGENHEPAPALTDTAPPADSTPDPRSAGA